MAKSTALELIKHHAAHPIQGEKIAETVSVAGFVGEAAVGGLAGYGIGRVSASGSDSWWARNIAKLSAIVGKGGAVLAAMFVGHGFVSSTLNTVGQAGVVALGVDLGIQHGLEKSGLRIAAVPPGAELPPGSRDLTRIGGDSSMNTDLIEKYLQTPRY